MAQNSFPNHNNTLRYDGHQYNDSSNHGFQQPGTPQNHGHLPVVIQGQTYARHPSQINGYTNQQQQQTIDQVPNYTLVARPGNQGATQARPRTLGGPNSSRASGGCSATYTDISCSQAYAQSNGPSKKLKENFSVRDPEFFVPGAVFLALWAEPAGEKSKKTSSRITPATYDEQYVFNQIRRFAVFEQKARHALCVPITTYGGQGTKKIGIVRDAHAVIYTSSEPPLLLPEEKPLIRRPIRVRAENEILDPASRVNFEKFYTIEYNQKVALVGHVDQNDTFRLKRYAGQTLGLSLDEGAAN